MVTMAEDNSNALVGTAISFLALTYMAVALRTYVRAGLKGIFFLDDWLMLVSQAVFTTSCAFVLLGVKAGLGKHNKALAQDDEIEALKWQALATATYIPSMTFIKLSYGIFLVRIAFQRRYIYTFWATMLVVTIWSTVLFFWDIFQCKPVRAQWDYTIPGAKCVTTGQVISAAYALSAMAVVTDFIYALLPIAMVWNVKMTKQAKITVVVLLGLGIFASVATLIRVNFLSALNDTDNLLFAGTDAMVWTIIEPGVAIVASSLVTIRPLLQAMRIKGFAAGEDSDTPPYHPNQPRTGTGTDGRAYAWGSMPVFGQGDVRLADVGDLERGPPHLLPPKQGVGSSALGLDLFTTNDSDVSLPTIPVAVKGAIGSG